MCGIPFHQFERERSEKGLQTFEVRTLGKKKKERKRERDKEKENMKESERRRKRIEKENLTIDVASSTVANGARKKSRSKSIGPGGLDVLKSSTGNRRVVRILSISHLSTLLTRRTSP